MILGSGCFDGLHAGHARYFTAMKKLAQKDELVAVGVAPDDYIGATKKRQPHWTQADRARTVHECGIRALAHSEASVAELIRTEKPRMFVKGTDWAGRLPEDVLTACKEVGAQIIFVYTPGVHTSEAIG